MPFTLPPLTYAFDALEPFIDAKTMEIHTGKHHPGVRVDNTQQRAERTPRSWPTRALDWLVANLAAVRWDRSGTVPQHVSIFRRTLDTLDVSGAHR